MVKRSLSIEDGELNRRSLITSRTSDYSDIDGTFTLRTSGDVYKKIDAAAVKQSVKNIVMTNRLEKPFNPKFGGNLQKILFELMDEDSEDLVENYVRTAIERYEPRAKVLEVDVNIPDGINTLNVRIVFQVVNSGETVTLDTRIIRVR